MTDYLTVKKKLKALNYNGFFTEESTGIIDRLLQDLIKASEAYQLVKKQLCESEKQKPSLKTMNLTEIQLQTAITTLQKENNELHEQLLNKEELINKLELRVKRETSKTDEITKTIELYQKSGKGVDMTPMLNRNSEEAKIDELKERLKFLEGHVEDYKAETRRLRYRYEGSFNEAAIHRDNELDTINRIKEKEEYYTNQLSFVTKQNDNLTREIESYKTMKLPELTGQLRALKSKNEECVEQINRLKDALAGSEAKLRTAVDEVKEKTTQGANSYYIRTIEDYSSKVKAKNDEYAVLAREKEQADYELKEMNAKAASIELELIKQIQLYNDQTNKSSELDEKLSKIMADKKELEIGIAGLEHKVGTLETDKTRLTNDYKKLQADFEMLVTIESNSRTLIESNKLDIAKRDLEISRLTSSIGQLQASVGKLHTDIDSKERELQLYREKSSEGTITTFKLHSLTDELESLRQSHKVAIEELERHKEEIAKFSHTNLDLKQKVKLKKGKLKIQEKFNKEKEKRIEELERHNIEAKKHIMKLEEVKESFDRLKISTSVDKQSSERVSDLELKLKTIQYEKEILCTSVDRLKEQAAILGKDKESLEAKLLTKEREVSQLKEQLLDLEYQQKTIKDVVARVQVTGESREDQLTHLGQQLREATDETNNYKRVVKELEYTKAQLQDKIAELQNAKSAHDSTISSLQLQLDNLQSNNKALEDQLALKSNQILTERSRTSTSNTKTDLLQRHIEQLESTLSHREQQLESIKTEYEQVIRSNENLRGQKDDLLKANSAIGRNLDGNFSNRVDELQKANIQLKERLEGYLLIEKNLKTNVLTLDAERDELEEQIDERNQAVERLQRDNRELNQQLKSLIDEKTQLEVAMSNIAFKQEHLYEERQDMLKDLSTLVSDDKVLKERLTKLEREKFELSSDLTLISAEHKALSNNNLLLTKKVENLAKKLEQKQERLKELEYLSTGASLEKDQLYNNCKIFEKENQKLKYDISVYEKDINVLAQELKEAKTALYTRTVDQDQLKHQYEILSTSLSKLQNEYERLSIEYKDKLMKEIDVGQQLKTLQVKLSAYEEQTGRLNTLMTEKDKHIEKVTEDYKGLKDNFLFIKKKNEEMSSRFSDEIKRSSQLESELHDERQKHAGLVHTIHKNRLISSQIESKIESVEKMFKYK